MVKKYKYRGLMAPVFTAYDSSPRLNLDQAFISKYAAYLKSKGVEAILVNGTTGEHVLMSTSERETVVECWSDAIQEHQMTMMVQVGGAPLPDVLEMARHAECFKVSGILCLPDLFFKPKTVDELIGYLKVVGKAAPKTPLFYYHIPAFTGVNLSMSEFLRDGALEIPTLSGIKYTSNDLDEGARCLRVHKDLTVFLGADTVYAGALALGFDSAIMTTLNFWPEDFVEIERLLKEGKVEEAMSLQSRISESIDQILDGGNWVEKMKSYMVSSIGIPVGLSRLSFYQ